MDEITTSFRRNRLAVVILMILLVAIPLSIYLVRQQQILKGRAVHQSSIQFVGSNVSGGNVATARDITVRLTYEPDPTPTTAQPTVTPTNSPIISAIPTLPPFPGGSSLCTITGPYIMTAGVQYSAISSSTEGSVSCNSGQYANPGTCLWGFLAGSPGTPPGKYFKSSIYSSSNQLTINPSDQLVSGGQERNVSDLAPGYYWLFFFRIYGGTNLPIITCVKNVSVTGI